MRPPLSPRLLPLLRRRPPPLTPSPRSLSSSPPPPQGWLTPSQHQLTHIGLSGLVLYLAVKLTNRAALHEEVEAVLRAQLEEEAGGRARLLREAGRLAVEAGLRGERVEAFEAKLKALDERPVREGTAQQLDFSQPSPTDIRPPSGKQIW
ncbi:hypothetical protein AB1Y20_016996 [Prymnesium parvum]|uniref:ATP synthase subunit e, mitochondrial n=1 Tax=Prymnesium parvum TaxID=97485 RepID=A0AB34IAW0_PRYPA